MNPFMIKLLLARFMLSIWDPTRWDWHPIESTKRKMQLHYKARGIVLHDRALSGRLAPEDCQ